MKTQTEIAIEKANLILSVQSGLISWTQYFWLFKRLEHKDNGLVLKMPKVSLV